MNLKPLGDRVVIEVIEEDQKTVSGIVLPDTAKEKSQRGRVVAVGAGRYEGSDLIPMTLNTGDEVLYAKYGGTDVTVDGVDYLIMRESDILAVLAKTAVPA